MKIKPLNDRVLVVREEEEQKSTGGIIIPDTAKEKPQRGTVVEVGPSKMGEDGKRIPLEVKVGDRVFFPKYAGHEGSVVYRKVLEGKDDFGFNAETEAYENLMASGVIDPTKVVRYALQNAASVAGLMITTEAAITEKPPRKSKTPAMPDMDEDMY